MPVYSYKTQRRRFNLPRRVWGLLIIIIVIAIGGVIVTKHVYNNYLQPVSSSQNSQVFKVESGSSVKLIADNLETDHLIRSSWALQLYVHSKDIADKLQAGTYAFSPDESTTQIVGILTKGRVATQLVTILPGKRVDQLSAALINDGFSPKSVNSALNNLSQYSDLPVMAFKPANVNTLEGLLWPDSWYKDANTPASYIIRESLTEMGKKLTPSVQAAFVSENLTVYQGITLTSIVQKEVSKPTDQTQVAQVFLSRLKSNSSLGSDVTADYGSIISGRSPSLTYDTPYNTLIHTGLPPTPISTISASALFAVTHPSPTNWLYFVTGDNGTTYFSTNLQDQQSNTQKYCHKLCSQ
jgi:UPF0755 protein